MVIDLTKLRFYALKSEDLKGDDTTETAACTVAPFQQEHIDTAQDGDLLSTVTCDFAANGPLPAGKDTFRLIKSGSKIRIENAARENLAVIVNGSTPPDFDPAVSPHILITRAPSASGTPYSIFPFGGKMRIEGYLDNSKQLLRTTRKDVDFPIGPLLSLEVGGFYLSGTEVDLPSVRDPLLETPLERYAADTFTPDLPGFALDATLHYAFLGQKEDYGWLGTILDTVASVGLRLRTSTLSANDTVSGIPGERSELSYLQGGLFWRLGLSTQSIARASVSDFHKSKHARWDVGAHYETPLAEGERFRGTFPWGGRSLAEALDAGQFLTVGDSHALNFSASYCFEKGGRWAPCVGLIYKYQFGHRFDDGDFHFDMEPQHDLQIRISFLNTVKTENMAVTDPYDVIVPDVPEPVVLPPTPPAPTIQADPPPPPALVGIPLPDKFDLDLSGTKAFFAQGSSALPGAGRKAVDAEIIAKIGEFRQARIQKGYSPNEIYYVDVYGYTNTDGGKTPAGVQRNLNLSERRAGEGKTHIIRSLKSKNTADWRTAKRANPKLKLTDWMSPYPDPANIVFRTLGFGQSEPVFKPDGTEDKAISRRFAISVNTNPVAAAKNTKTVGTVSAEAQAVDAANVAAIATALGPQASYDTSTKTIYYALPLSWSGQKLAPNSATIIGQLRNKFAQQKKLFGAMSREVSVQFGILSSPAAAEESLEFDRAGLIADALYGRKQFESWPVKGATSVIPLPSDTTDALKSMREMATQPQGPKLPEATAKLRQIGKSVSINGQSATLYALPIALSAGEPTGALLNLVAAVGKNLTPGDYLYGSLYQHSGDTFNTDEVMNKLVTRLTDTHLVAHTLEKIAPTHFVVQRTKAPLADKATRLYIVVSDQFIDPDAISQKIFDLALPHQP